MRRAIKGLLFTHYATPHTKFLTLPPYLAVDFFFCLSGFVIAHAYTRRLSRGMSMGDFVARRFMRLYPMAFIGVLLGVMTMLASVVLLKLFTLSQVLVIGLGAVLFLPTGFIFHLVSYPANVPLWSIFFEFIANVVYAAIVKWCRVSPRMFAAGLGVAAIGLLLVAFAVGSIADVGVADPALFLLGFVRVTYPFAVGIALYHVRSRFTWLRVHSVLINLAILAILLTPVPAKALYETLCIIAVMPMLVLAGSNAVSTARLDRFWALLGRISYPVYAVHNPILGVLAFGYQKFGHMRFPVATEFLATALVAFASWLILVAYDEPVRARLQKLYYTNVQ